MRRARITAFELQVGDTIPVSTEYSKDGKTEVYKIKVNKNSCHSTIEVTTIHGTKSFYPGDMVTILI